MTQFSNVCGASPSNNQILLFDVHGSHFNYGALRQIMRKNIQLFVPKSGDSINDQPNDNGPNAKLRFLYNVANSVWLLKCGIKKFSPHHMNSVLGTALACPSSAGTRAGAGNRQVLETPWPLVSAQKGAQKKTSHQKTPRYGAAQERVRKKHDGGGQESRECTHDPLQDRQRPGHMSRPAEGGG